VLGDLKAIGYRGEVAFSGFSEPLLHPAPERLVIRARAMLPEATLQMITNADRLDVDTLRELFGAGLDELVISLYDGPEQTDEFEAMRIKAGIPEHRVILRRRYYDGSDYGVNLSNRGGLVDVERFGKRKAELPLQRQCFYPFSCIKIDLNGDVMFCPHNWSKKSLIGNVKNENLWEIWTNQKIESIRETLSQSSRNIPSCVACDVDGRKAGEQSYLTWKSTRST
jgi:radical SAM protein with 4Fe4S-binding SPASM domain